MVKIIDRLKEKESVLQLNVSRIRAAKKNAARRLSFIIRSAPFTAGLQIDFQVCCR